MFGLIASISFSSLTSSTTLTLRYCTRSPGKPTRLTSISGTSTNAGGLTTAASACASSPCPRMKKNQPAPPPTSARNPTAAIISLSLPFLAGAASAASAGAPPSASFSAIARPPPQHDPKRSCSNQNLERDDGSKKSHHALGNERDLTSP